MIRLPHDLHARLLANGLERDMDHVPALKLFNPQGAATWLATELDLDGDTLIGLADLGFGCPELGPFSLSGIGSDRLPFGAVIERDILFEGRFPLSVYVEAARLQGAITEMEHHLRAAEARLRGRGRG